MLRDLALRIASITGRIGIGSTAAPEVVALNRPRPVVLSPDDCRELLPYLETATPRPLQRLARRCRAAIGDDHE